MTETFAVGEVCFGINLVFDLDRNGDECVIIRGLTLGRHMNRSTGVFEMQERFRVRWSDGVVTNIRPRNLRKKRPPASDEAAHRQAMIDCIERAKRGSEVPA